MDIHHRKIDLQSPTDLTYLLQNIQAAAREKIDLAIPASAAPKGEEDAYRTKVEELVNDYITRTLLLALPNLSINGFDPPASLITPHPTSNASADKSAGGVDLSDEEIATGNYSAYDPRLAERLRALYGQYESEAEDVSRMRRSVPGKAAEAYAQALQQAIEKEVVKGDVKKEEEAEEDKEEVGRIVGLGERQEEVEKVMRRGLEELEKLEGITGVIAKLEQTERAIEVVKA